MRGASAIQKVLSEIPDARLSLLVIWEPVLWTDIAAPTSGVLSRVTDPRAAQFWDKGRLLSKAMGETDGDIVWDYVAIYPPGLRFIDSPPDPVFDGSPVVEVIQDVRRWLAPGAVAPAPSS